MSPSSRFVSAGATVAFLLSAASCEPPAAAPDGEEADSTTSSALTTESVVWTALQNVTATGASLSKTGGVNQQDDAGAVSSLQLLSGDGWVEFTASEVNTLRCLGLHPGAARVTCANLAHALRLQAGILEVRERGVYRTDTRFIPGDVLRVAVIGGVVKYLKNGNVFFTGAKPAGYPLGAMAALIDSGATIADAKVAFRELAPPAISAIQATPSATGVTVTWTTDRASTSQVGVGVVDGTWQWTAVDRGMVTSHSMAITGLKAGTLYHLRVASYDLAGRFTMSPDVTFTIVAPGIHHRCGWLFTSDARAVNSFTNNVGYYDAIHPVWYALNADGVTLRALATADDAAFTNTARANRVALIPLVASVDDVRYTRTMLYSADKRAAHVAALVNLAVSRSYAGLELDYEKLWDVADHAPLIAFVQAFGAAMHAAGKVASMAVPALPNPSTVWTYPDLAAALDQAHLMGYDFHTIGTHAGPTAPLAWIDAVNARVASTGHPEKFLLGLPNYGVSPNGACQLADCAARCNSAIATTTMHMQGCPSGAYYTPGERILSCNSDIGVLHFDDTMSLQAKVASARSRGLAGVTYWNLGGEPAGFFQMVRGYY